MSRSTIALIIAAIIFTVAVQAALAAPPRTTAQECRSAAKMIYSAPAQAQGSRLVITPCVKHGRSARRCVVRYGSTRVELVVRATGPEDIVAYARPVDR